MHTLSSQTCNNIQSKCQAIPRKISGTVTNHSTNPYLPYWSSNCCSSRPSEIHRQYNPGPSLPLPLNPTNCTKLKPFSFWCQRNSTWGSHRLVAPSLPFPLWGKVWFWFHRHKLGAFSLLAGVRVSGLIDLRHWVLCARRPVWLPATPQTLQPHLILLYIMHVVSSGLPAHAATAASLPSFKGCSTRCMCVHCHVEL